MARTKLPKKFTAKCGRCKHGAAAHVGGKKCHMKHCKCEKLK
jgi:hypothetical protein